MPSSKPDADADFLSNHEAASPSAERSSPVRAVTDDSNAQTVLPQSRELLDADTRGRRRVTGLR
ncbi:MAG: hypothetical protein NT013_07860 [Planctomycetia bacterium]|nr:hypothetical protein [Planctomycetia bacterium]